jgi:hypothetical protein
MASDRLALDPRGTVSAVGAILAPGRHPAWGTGPVPSFEPVSPVRGGQSPHHALATGVKIARSRPTATIFPILWWRRRPTTTSSASRLGASVCAGSGLPMPLRRTFAQGRPIRLRRIGARPSLTRMQPALRNPCCAWLHTPALGHGQPLADLFMNMPNTPGTAKVSSRRNFLACTSLGGCVSAAARKFLTLVELSPIPGSAIQMTVSPLSRWRF